VSVARRLMLSALAALAFAVAAFEVWIASTTLPDLRVVTSTEVRARGGELLRAFTVEEGRWRFASAVDDVDPTYLAMLLAFEDRRFASHRGVDPLAFARAALQALRAGRVVSGASTITMQVARLLEGGARGGPSAKVRQIRVAMQLERRLDKREILSLYLHLAPMGGNLEGVRAGSLAWFGREPARLTPAEAALLIALPQSPTSRDPLLHPEAARRARDAVLARAAAVGVIDVDTARAAQREALPSERRSFPMLAPHTAERLAAAEGGVIATTLDAPLQAALEEVARGHLTRSGAGVAIAIVVADVASGEIRASIGSGDYGGVERSGFVDMTRALRSPGSALKPLVYALAFSDAVAHPETLLRDAPATFDGYAPANFDARYRGDVTARVALQTSANLPAVALAEAVGPARLLTALRHSGARVVVPGDAPGLAIALGGLGIDLEGLVAVHAAIARGGEAIALRVVPGGEAEAAEGVRVMTPEAAWFVADALAGAPRPPAAAQRVLAYKTGTSHGHRDAWAIGFDGAVVAGVWVGRADGGAVPGLTGFAAAAPVLLDVFTHASPRGVPLPPAPAGALLATTAELPAALRVFGGFEDRDAPRVTFPPDGAALTPLAGGLPARVEQGAAPFTWFVDGVPVVVASGAREERLAVPGPGFVTLSVVDAWGRGDAVRFEVRDAAR
jgi:penicillin-binding protein 1C